MNGAMKLIRNARLYAPEDLGCMDVLIGGGKILRIGESLPAEEAYHVEVIDGSGKIMMPGLIDAHVHILGGGGEGGYRTRTPDVYKRQVLEPPARLRCNQQFHTYVFLRFLVPV